MAEQAAVINYPEWSDYRRKNGLDPLGMRNSSVSLYQTLSSRHQQRYAAHALLRSLRLALSHLGFFEDGQESWRAEQDSNPRPPDS
jgi:hypothetical protein